ncbi:aminoglycoside phosphotransferase [Nitrospira sp.]|nr:aminoglycoside phosphotransferase [Nitrospira sp.]
MATANPAVPTAPLAPPSPTLIAETIRNHIRTAGQMTELAPLAGDASNRRYFRIHLQGGSIPSLVLMQLAEPEAFKQSEEAVSGAAVTVDELPFTNILTHLSSFHLPVPKLHYYDREAGLLYLEDFGDVTLLEACVQADPGRIAALYKQAVDSLVLIQAKATAPANTDCVAFHRTFDVPLLMWEFDHFLEYGIVARQGRPMCADDMVPIRNEFRRIAEMMAAQPHVFVHRDYHSRNLMVDGSRIGIIDFQDALMGPAAYDLASLLRDAYIALDEPLVDELIAHYLEGLARHGLRVEPTAYRRVFDLTSMQRNLKAAGRFVYIERVKHNPKFLADIPRVLGYVRSNLARYPELATLRQHLTPYVPELQ